MGAAPEPTIAQFVYLFAGVLHRCGYCISGNKLLVVVGEHQTVADCDCPEPARLARILVHELLVRDAFAGRRND